jgi:hypothetical protein
MLASDSDALPIEHVTEHPGTHERVVQVHLVDPAHFGQIGLGWIAGTVSVRKRRTPGADSYGIVFSIRLHVIPPLAQHLRA